MSAVPWLQAKDSASTGSGTTAYACAGNTGMVQQATEAIRQRTMLTGGTWANLWVRVVTNDRTNSATLQSRKNLADGNQIITIGAGATGEFSDTTHTDSVAAGDEINWKWVFGSGGTAMVYRGLTSLYTPASGVLQAWYASDGSNVSLNGVTRFNPLTGAAGADDAINQTEAKAQYSSRCAGTWQGLMVNVSTNAKGGNSFVVSRVNGADGAQTITIGAAVTGILQDTTHTDSVVSGDEINYATKYFADGNTLRLQGGIASEFAATSAAPNVNSSSADLATTQALNVTNYYGSGVVGIAGGFPSTTESNMRTEVLTPVTLTYLSVYVVANSITSNSTFAVRKNGAAGNNGFTVGSAATGYFEDATHSDSFAATDELNYQVVTANAGTSLQFNSLAAVMSAAQTYTISPTGGIVPSGVLAKSALKGVTGAVAPSGAITRTTTKAAAGSIASSGSTVRLAGKGLTGAVAPSGTATRSTSKTAGGSVTPTGNPANLTDKGLAGAIVLTGLLVRASSAIYAGVLVPVGSLSKAMAIAIGGALAPTGALATMRAVLLTLIGNITPSGTLSRAVSAGIAGTLAPSGGVVKGVSVTLRGTVAPTGGPHKLIQKFWSGFLDLLGQLATLIGAAHVPSRLDVVGTYVPTIAVEVVYQQQLAVTGAYAPAISVTGEFDA